MDSVLSSLGTLINNFKNLTLPGLVAALGFALLLWPPQPIDVVTDARVNDVYNPWPTTADALTKLAKDNFGPVCETSTGTGQNNATLAKPLTSGRERVLRQPEGLSENKPVAVANQFDLERIQRQLQDCAEKETALSGAEDALIADINAEIGVLIVERDGIRDTYLGYEKTVNPLRGPFLQKLKEKETEIRNEQKEVYEKAQLKRERTRRSTELTRLSDEVKQRLQEPGRLRPLQKFDDFLASLGSHVIAFLALAIAWSLLFEPINRAVFGFIYDRGFNDQLDYVWWDSNSRDTHINLTEKAKKSARAKAQSLGTDATPAKKAGPPSLPSILWALALGAAAIIGLTIILVFNSLSHQPSGVPKACIGVVGDCPEVLGSAPSAGWLFLSCVLATVAGLCLALAGTWLWSRKKWNERVKPKGQSAQPQHGPAQQGPPPQVPPQPAQAQQVQPQQVQIKHKQAQQGQTQQIQTSDDKAARDCHRKLVDQWTKIKQPEYAIGQGLMTRDAYNAIRSEYYTQSTMSIGIILPLLFLIFALLATPQMGLTAKGFWVWFCLIMAQLFLVLVGADRRHKFDMEVETTIASTFLKNCEAAKTKADDPTPKPPTVIDLIQAELKKARIVENKNYNIEPG